MAQKRYTNNSKNNDNANKEIVGVVLILVSCLFLVCLIFPILFGAFSELVEGILKGTFGFMAYPFLVSLVLLGVAFVQKRRLRVQVKYAVGIAVISFFVIMILQLATSRTYLSEKGIGDYLSKVYKGFTGGGAFFGVFAYIFYSVFTEVFSYIIYSLCIIVTAFLMTKDKLKLAPVRTDNRKKEYYPEEHNFKKGVRPAREVRPLADTTLFIDTIKPIKKEYSSSVGNFNSLSTGKQANLQTYSTANNNSKTVFNEIVSEKKSKPINFFNATTNSNATDLPPATQFIQDVQNTQSNSQVNNILPVQSYSAPDIHNPSVTPIESEPVAKPPKILHFEDLGFPAVKMPPFKDISASFVSGPIINGDELSQKLESKKVDSNIQKIQVPQYDGFDKRKSEPIQVQPKIEQKPEPEIVRAPIVNGDYYGKNNESEQSVQSQTPKIEPKKSFSINEIETNYKNNVSNKADNISKLENIKNITESKKDSYIYDMENDYEPVKKQSASNLDFADKYSIEYDKEYNFDEKFRSNIKSNPDSALSYQYGDEDEPVEDLSEKGFDYSNDFTGYYNEVKTKQPNLSSVVFPEQKLKPENQIKLDDYAKQTVHAEPKPKPKKRNHKYNPPPLDLLLPSITNATDDTENDSNEKARLLEETLKGLKLPATVCAITRGPAVTRYELEVPPGIPVKRIEQFVKDIEYNLASNGRIRIETPIPGKRAVGVEVPNALVDVVALKDIIGSKEFNNSSSPITLALGKDIAGANIVCSLDKMPHLLIAGATGSGKSACLNSIIISMLYKASPEDVRIILIDPKQVEFAIYRDMPHLLTNEIITDAVQALNAFKWVKLEMERRYTLFSQHVVRNISEYNKLEEVKSGEMEKLPNIVLIVDELAELMMSNDRKDLEEKIMSMSQKARAAGIHLILATQRPSVDVITGTIKANLPSRIAFAVKSVIDSRTILDSSGAETLLGRGDMLYAPIGVDDPRRVQGAFITSEEVALVVDYVKDKNQFDFDEDFKNALTVKEEAVEYTSEEDESEFDPLMPQILKLALDMGTISTSLIQRRFAVGYARASRIIDQMEGHKFIGQLEGSKPRTVYITREQFVELFGEENL